MTTTLQEDLLTASRDVLDAFIADKQQMEQIQLAADVMVKCLQNGGKIIACGNGGSMSDAIHFCAELTGKFKTWRQALPALAICDVAHITAVANDHDFDAVFERYIDAFGKEYDVLLAISTSGNSPNIINAIQEANRKRMEVILLTGSTGGKMKEMMFPESYLSVDDFIHVPSTDTRLIQEVHIKVLHVLVMMIEKQMGLA